MTTVHTLASGSSGNALLLCSGETRLLIDAGISCRRISAALKQLNLSLDDLSAILITHSHADHTGGLKTLLKRTQLPVLGSARTCRELEWQLPENGERLREIAMCQPFPLWNCRVTAFPLSHDAPGTCGFRIDTEDGGVGVITDTGYVTEEAADILPGVNLAVLEANHDVEWVESGPYPYSLKRRILGAEGHLNNEDAARFAVTLAENGAEQIVLAHLSQENNTPAMARRIVETALSAAGKTVEVTVAPRESLSEPYFVRGRDLCRK